jgi:hypothetical protein
MYSNNPTIQGAAPFIPLFANLYSTANEGAGYTVYQNPQSNFAMETRLQMVCNTVGARGSHGRIYWGLGGLTPPRISLTPLIKCSTPPPILCESL